MGKDTDRYKRYRNRNIKEIREKDRLRKQQKRKDATADVKKASNDGAKVRMQLYRQRLKAKKQATKLDVGEPSTSTPKEVTANTREANRLRQQKCRASQSWQKHSASKAKNRQRYHGKKRERAAAMLHIATKSKRIRIPRKGLNYANAVDKLIDAATPSKRKYLENRSLFSSKDRYDQRELSREIIKDKNTKSALLSKMRMQGGVNKKKLAKYFGIRRMTLSYRRKLRQPSLNSVAIHRTIKQFFTKKTVVTECPDKLKKTSAYLQRSVRSSYDMFVAEHGRICSYGTFCMLRPGSIKPFGQAKTIGCLCEKCENIKLKVDTIRTCMQGLALQVPDFLKSVNRLSSATICTTTDGNPRLVCLKRECGECGTGLLEQGIEPFTTAVRQPVTYFEWGQYPIINSSGDGEPEKKKTAKKPKQAMADELVKSLITELKDFSMHLFNANHQNAAYEMAKERRKESTALAVLDFAENFTSKIQREIQSHHWHHASITLHPVVMYYTTKEGEDIRDCLDFVTDDRKHDSAAVEVFLKETMIHLAAKSKATRLIIFSDGCAGQYKGKTAFWNLCEMLQQPWFKRLGINLEWHFYGSRHGKGESDGESGTVKSYVDRAIRGRGIIINSAQEFSTFIHSEMERPTGSSQRHVRFIDQECMDRDVGNRNITTLAGTRKIHVVKPECLGKLLFKEASCFCDSCEEGSNCTGHYQERWKTGWLLQKGSRLRKIIEQEEIEREQATDQPVAVASQPSQYDDDDFLQDIDWSDSEMN